MHAIATKLPGLCPNKTWFRVIQTRIEELLFINSVEIFLENQTLLHCNLQGAHVFFSRSCLLHLR